MCGLDRGAIGQRNDGADTGDCHEAPTHVVVADDGQQAAMEDAELLAKHPADNKQWFDQYCQVREVLDQFRDTRLEPGLTGYSDLEAKVTLSIGARNCTPKHIRRRKLELKSNGSRFGC